MRFSTRTRYGLRFLLRLADLGEGELLSLGEVASAEDISPGYLEQIVRILKPAGFLYAERGSNGGYRLAVPPEEIMLSEIFKYLEGDLAPIACLANAADCQRAGICSTRAFWRELDNHIFKFLDKQSLADINANKACLLSGKNNIDS